LLGVSGALLLRVVGPPLLVFLMGSEHVSQVQSLTWISLGIPLDFICWHGLWYLLVLGESWVAAAAQGVGVVVHIGLSLAVMSGANDWLGLPLFVSLAISALVFESIVSIRLKDLGYLLVSVAAVGIVAILQAVPMTAQTTPVEMVIAATAVAIGLSGLAWFLLGGRNLISRLSERFTGLEP
jgi:hypothetical protein